MAVQIVEENLKSNGFEILGSYVPIEDNDRRVIAYTSSEIVEAVKRVGGLTAFASAWRVGLTTEGDEVIISYNTPEYWGNAYFREDYHKVADLYENYELKITKALAACGQGGGESFGSEKGLDVDKLQTYRYKLSMPKFDKTKVLNEFESFAQAVQQIDQNLANGITNLELVYSVEIPGSNTKLYGIGLRGEDGESKFMPKIDVSNPRHTAFLPYEILVVENKVHMLHGRYRIALSFPDLKMGQFMKIVSTPPTIKRMMETATQ